MKNWKFSKLTKERHYFCPIPMKKNPSLETVLAEPLGTIFLYMHAARATKLTIKEHLL
jgi:hypothetical protein